MKTKEVVQGERWEGNHHRRYEVQERNFIGTSFQELVVHLAAFRECRFTGCEFKNCCLGFDVRYFDCTWVNCKFHGKYMTFSDNSLFENCRFENVMIQSASTEGMTLRNCVISGRLRNMIWRGEASPRLVGKMVIDGCDLSGATFDNVNIYAGVDLSNSILPASGIRVFRNPRGSFSSALRVAGSHLEKDAGILLQVFGNEDCYARQDPVVFDIRILHDLLKLQISRDLFEAVAQEYEISPKLA